MESLIVTKSGKELMARVLSSMDTIIFTKIAISDYDYSNVKLADISELQGIRQTAIISKTSRIDSTTIEILAAINNEHIPRDYYIRTLGVFAKDSENKEILYGISIESENPDYMPLYKGKTLSGVSYRINIAVENSQQITVNVNSAAVPTIMQVEDIEAALNKHINDNVCHITYEEREKWNAVEDKVDKVKGKGLSSNDFDNVYKKKLDNIAEGANKYIHPSYTARGTGLYKISVDTSGHVNGVTAVTKGDITGLGIPGQDTKYTHPSYTARGTGLYKISVDTSGHVNSVTAVTKGDITGLGIPGQDTNTTYVVENNQVTTAAGHVADARQLNKSINGTFAYLIYKSLSDKLDTKWANDSFYMVGALASNDKDVPYPSGLTMDSCFVEAIQVKKDNMWLNAEYYNIQARQTSNGIRIFFAQSSSLLNVNCIFRIMLRRC